MAQQIRKAVFPVAGLGTRFLPATKASPKEMLPVVDKPLIQYAAEEAVAAGCDQLIFVTGRGKRAIADHFDLSFELEQDLENRGKSELLEMVRNILPPHVSAIYIRQPRPLGLGHAVLCAEPVVGNEPFAVILADDLIDGGKLSSLSQMVDVYQNQQASVLGVEAIDPSDTDKYGIVELDEHERRLGRVSSIVEKPSPALAQSNLAVVGRYILTPTIFEQLKDTGQGLGGEIQLTDAISTLLEREPVYAYQFEGERYDCGSKLGYLQATVEYALKHEELGSEFGEYLLRLVNEGKLSGKKRGVA